MIKCLTYSFPPTDRIVHVVRYVASLRFLIPSFHFPFNVPVSFWFFVDFTPPFFRVSLVLTMLLSMIMTNELLLLAMIMVMRY